MTEKKKEKKNEKKIIIMYSRFLFNKYYKGQAWYVCRVSGR